MKYLCPVEVSSNRFIDWIICHWSESQCPSVIPKVQNLQTCIVLTECGVFNTEFWQFLQCMVIKLYSGNHHLTYEREQIWRVSGGLVHETGKVSNTDKKMTVFWLQGKGLEISVILYQPCSHRLPKKGYVSFFPAFTSVWFNVFWWF